MITCGLTEHHQLINSDIKVNYLTVVLTVDQPLNNSRLTVNLKGD